MFKIRRAAAGGLLLTAFLLTVAEHGRAQIPGLPTSSASHSQRVVCDPGLALVAAEGVPGEPRHVYLFEGTCRAQSLTSKAGKTTVTSEHLFPAELEVAWDPSLHRLSEGLEILEATSGRRRGSCRSPATPNSSSRAPRIR